MNVCFGSVLLAMIDSDSHCWQRFSWARFCLLSLGLLSVRLHVRRKRVNVDAHQKRKTNKFVELMA